MRKLLLLLALSAAVATLALADAPDSPALPDGGSLVTSAGGLPGDGGGPYVTVDTGQTGDWTMTIRCRSYAGSPAVHYLLSTSGTTATTANSVLDVDRTFDIPVSQGGGEKYRYLSLLGEDGGPPACIVLKNPR